MVQNPQKITARMAAVKNKVIIVNFPVVLFKRRYAHNTLTSSQRIKVILQLIEKPNYQVDHY